MDNQPQQRLNKVSVLGFAFSLYSITLSALSFLVFVYDIRSPLGRIAESSFFYIPFTSLAATIMGIISLIAINKNNQKGKTIAILSIVLGAIAFIPFVLLLSAIVAGASLLKMI